jgi:hypothetical protein
MDNNKILAQYLYDMAKESKSEFVEISADSELVKIAKKMNLIVPSPDIAVLKTVYAQTDVANLNKILLPKEAVKKALPNIIGKQANWSHKGKNYICGWILDAKLEKDLIIIYIAIFKSLFNEEFETMKQMVKDNKMAVSFEIWNKNEKGESVLHDLGNGIKSIDPIIFHGVGILIEGESPACPKAYADKLLAIFNQKELENAEKIVDKIFEQDLIYAQMAIEEPKCNNCGNCNSEKGGNKNIMLEELFANITKEEEITFDLAMLYYYATDEEKTKLTEDAAKWTKKFINDLPDSAFAAIEPAYPEKTQDKNARHLPHHNGEGDLGKDKSNANLDLPHYKNALARCNQIKPISDSISAEELQKKANAHLERHKDALEKSSDETKTEVKPEETKTEVKPEEKPMVAETKPVETKVEETKEVKAEVKPEEKKEEKAQTPVETIVPKIIVKVTKIYSDVYVDTYIDGTMSGTSEGKSYFKKVTEYKDGTKDEVENESEFKTKYDLAQLEEAVKKAKEELTTLHKAELEAKTNEVKTSLEQKITEKETEISNLKKELDAKAQEIAKLTPPVVIPEGIQASLEVGNVEEIKSKEKKEIETAKSNIDKIIAEKHNDK